MEPDAFPSEERGEVRKALEGFWAFYPHPLPRGLDLSRTCMLALDDATAAVHRLGGVGLLLPNPHLLIMPHLRLEALLSSRIEGTRTDLDELLLFEAGELSGDEAKVDAQEVSNYIVAMEFGLQRLREDFPLSVRLLRDMHTILMSGVRGRERRPGELRSSPNWIGGPTIDRAVFVPPPPDAMGEALDDWEQFLHDDSHPLLIHLALAHYQFEAIHPFLDGNGRIGRLLMPLLLIQRRALPQPLIYLSAYFEEHRSTYYELLLSTSQRGDLEPWLLFFLEGVRQQAQDAQERTVRLVELQQRMREELLAEFRSPNVARLGDLLFATPILSAATVERELGVTRPTASGAIDALVQRGDLVEITGRSRNRVYRADGILDVVYRSTSESDGRP